MLHKEPWGKKAAAAATEPARNIASGANVARRIVEQHNRINDSVESLINKLRNDRTGRGIPTKRLIYEFL